MSATVIPLFPPTPRAAPTKRRRYGVTRTGSCWHLVGGGGDRGYAECGIMLHESITLPAQLQPDGQAVCLTCRGIAARKGGSS